jgi:hypothetical protein
VTRFFTSRSTFGASGAFRRIAIGDGTLRTGIGSARAALDLPVITNNEASGDFLTGDGGKSEGLLLARRRAARRSLTRATSFADRSKIFRSPPQRLAINGPLKSTVIRSPSRAGRSTNSKRVRCLRRIWIVLSTAASSTSICGRSIVAPARSPTFTSG